MMVHGDSINSTAANNVGDRVSPRKRDRKSANLSSPFGTGTSLPGSPSSAPSMESSALVGSGVGVSPMVNSSAAVLPLMSAVKDVGSPPPAKIPRLGMFETYQPWVLQTYGDSAKTKTITKNKYQRILQILRGDYIDNETSKFKLWVKGRGFRIGPPPGYFLDNCSTGGTEATLGGGGGGAGGGGLTSIGGGQSGVDYNPDKDPRPDIFVQTGTVKVSSCGVGCRYPVNYVDGSIAS